MKVHQNLEGIPFATGYRVIENRGVAIVGISPGNSYFKKETIKELLKKAHSLFSKVYVLVPAAISVHSFRALGLNEVTAQRYARTKGNDLKRHVQKSLEELSDILDISTIHILDWQNDIEPNAFHQEKLKHIYDLYTTHQEFRKDTQDTVLDVIGKAHQTQSTPIPEDLVNEGAHYVLKEIAFLLASPSILKAKDVTVVYHRKWPILDKFISGYYGENVPEIGHVIISKDEPKNNY